MGKLTPWFREDKKPFKRGVYQTRIDSIEGYSYWDGSVWMQTQPTPAGAQRDEIEGLQNKKWRGLTEAAYREAMRKGK